ncbi:MAG TPA: ATP-binding protein [Longimicrobium sp.]|jgi:ATP-dependent DNA helicase RecG|uniref:ATP-binding protein n=1 Tax=Longimicrobium sp. TaxID=2029185 RepID=UPI002EDB6047
MTSDELRDLLEQLQRQGTELTNVEAKRARDGIPRRIWETLSAFANTPGGGVLLLGVDGQQGFAPTGVSDAAKVQADLGAVAADQMEPPLRPLLQVFEIDGAAVVVAEVPELPASAKPCYYQGAGLPNGAFIRVGDGDRKLTPYEVQALFEARGQPRHDVEPVEGTSPDDLDPELLGGLLRRLRARESGPYRSWTDEQVLRALKVLVPGADGKLAVSLQGWTCFAPYPQERFPNLCVTFLRYPGTDAGKPGPNGERFLDNVKVEGPVPVMVVETLRVIKRNMQRRGIVQGLFREDLWEYPEMVLREALVNALGHRDLSAQARGSQVQVHMFPDRIEFQSPGGLFGPIQPDQLGEPGVQSSRNAFLMKVLEDLPPPGDTRPLCENRGTGLTAMIEQLRRAGMSPPRFDVPLTRFRVVLPNHTLYDEATLRWLQELARGEPVSEAQRQALAFVRHNGSMTNGDYCRVTGSDSRVATRELNEMMDRGLLERTGVGRWSTYAVADHAEPRTSPRRRRDRADEIVDLLGAEPLTARQIAAKLGLSASGVRYWLSRLRRAGRVQSSARTPTSPENRYSAVPADQSA